MMTFPWIYIKKYTFSARNEIQSTIDSRAKFDVFKKLLNTNVQENEKVYFIATNTNGQDYYIAKYEATPIKFNPYAWSIGDEAYSNEDIWTVIIPVSQWKQELIDNYEYVYLHNVDEKFIELYGSLFSDGKENIKNNQLYRVNKTEETETILELVVE